MKTIAGVRDCDEGAYAEARRDGNGKMSNVNNSKLTAYARGHAAACDVLIPALEEAIKQLPKSGVHREFALEKIRALLQSPSDGMKGEK